MSSPHGSSIFSLRLHFHPLFLSSLSSLPILHFILTFFILCSCLPSFLYSLSISPPFSPSPSSLPISSSSLLLSPLPSLFLVRDLLSAQVTLPRPAQRRNSPYSNLEASCVVNLGATHCPALRAPQKTQQQQQQHNTITRIRSKN